ncbi:MAG: mechanosensitive ion channel [Cyclobacteriaceae bacterium]
MIFVRIGLSALALIAVFRGGHWLFRSLVRRQTYWRKGNFLLIGVEFFAWIVWLFWVIHHWVADPVIYIYLTISLALILFGLLTWFLLRDMMAGIIFKLQHNLRFQQSIQVGETSGRLLRLGLTSLVLESASGEQRKIPYTRLINQTVTRYDASEVANSFDFQLQVPQTATKDVWLGRLKQQLLLLPWCSVKKPPTIYWQKEDADTFTFVVRAYTLNEQYAHRIENYLKEQYPIASP